jgi:Tfp pilus assembly protein PilF
LGINYINQYIITKDNEHLNKAKENLKIALNLDNLSKYWITLSFCYENNINFKLHCLLKSIEIDKNNYNAWDCLGLLYLQTKKFNFAQKSFLTSQNLNPKSSLSWIGLALINEFNNNHKLSYEYYLHLTNLENSIYYYLPYLLGNQYIIL